MLYPPFVMIIRCYIFYSFTNGTTLNLFRKHKNSIESITKVGKNKSSKKPNYKITLNTYINF